MTGEDLKDLDFVTILTDPISGNQYAMLTCGYWYWLEDDDNVRQMVEDEYEIFLNWIDAVNLTPSNFNKNNSDQPTLDHSLLSPIWTPRPKE